MATSDHNPPAGVPASPRCPKCGADRAPEHDACPACGVVFAKWYARRAAEAAGGSDSPPSRPAGRLRRKGSRRRGIGVVHWAIGVAVLAVVVVAGRQSVAPEPRGDDVIVTFKHGAECRLANWRFRYIRRYSRNRARGNVLVVGRTVTESRFDGALRVFEPLVGKLAVAREDLRSIALTVAPDPDNSFQRRVVALTLNTRDGVHVFETHEVPKYSRNRVLVPDAAHFYPDHFDDDYMHWANARVYLVGDPTPECGGNDAFNLTGDEYPKPWTPVHFDFPG